MSEVTRRLRELIALWRSEREKHPWTYNTQHDSEQNWAAGRDAAADELQAVLDTEGDRPTPTRTCTRCGHPESDHETIEYRGDKPRACMNNNGHDCPCSRFQVAAPEGDTSSIFDDDPFT
jgi:hypothetical protein